jgi:hypothetical protein
VNHAYTLSLYHVGDKARLADIAFQIADSLASHDPASSMDYFQRAMFAGLDPIRMRRIGQLLEQSAQPMPAAAASPAPAIDRVAHVIGHLSPDDERTKYVEMLVAGLRGHGIESSVFTTESTASWFFNPAGVAQSKPVEMLADMKIASLDGDFVQRAARIAAAIKESGIDVAFFHAGLDEQITARVASLRPVPVQVNVNHSSEMDADFFSGRIHLFERGLKSTRFPGVAEWIPPFSNIESRIRQTETVTRRSMGLDDASSVSATFGNLAHSAGREYLRALSEIMRRFPDHFHLFAGPGNVKVIRSFLHSEGVLPRVRFLGNISDVAPLLGMIDLYLASFPDSGSTVILDAMGAGKPVVALRNAGAELVGIRELMAPGAADYTEIGDRLLRSPGVRAQRGQAVQERFRSEFSPARLIERYVAFLARLRSSGGP